MNDAQRLYEQQMRQASEIIVPILSPLYITATDWAERSSINEARSQRLRIVALIYSASYSTSPDYIICADGKKYPRAWTHDISEQEHL